ncbi:MAG: fluoride efflux transporter CrcB [Flavipsychrobacter sp.]
MIKIFLAVFIGGGIGSFCRYMLGAFFAKYYPTVFPLSTFLINIIGCFLIGLLYVMSNKYHWFGNEWRLLLITGYCGAFTTFSTFAFENIKLLQSGQIATFITYSLLSYTLGLLAVLAGISFSRIL